MIIGLHGKARSGKDTAASYLAAKLDLTILSFAAPLKVASMELFNLTKQEAYGLDGYDREQPHDFWKISVRHMQQTLGTECMRNNFGQDFWVRIMQQKLQQLDGAIISDVRFQNEADFVKAQGGVLVEIVRPDHSDSLAGAQAAHSSENGVTGSDVVISNDGGLNEFYSKLFEKVVKHGSD